MRGRLLHVHRPRSTAGGKGYLAMTHEIAIVVSARRCGSLPSRSPQTPFHVSMRRHVARDLARAPLLCSPLEAGAWQLLLETLKQAAIAELFPAFVTKMRFSCVLAHDGKLRSVEGKPGYPRSLARMTG